jgi:hypothetical protein
MCELMDKDYQMKKITVWILGHLRKTKEAIPKTHSKQKVIRVTINRMKK